MPPPKVLVVVSLAELLLSYGGFMGEEFGWGPELVVQTVVYNVVSGDGVDVGVFVHLRLYQLDN